MKNRLINAYKKLKENKNFGFIKSFAILLLAVMLFVTSILAWYVSSSSAKAEGLSVNVKTNEIEVGSHGDSFSDQIYIPAATKPADISISASDLAKVVSVKSYELSTTNGATKVRVDFTTIPNGIMCYCFYSGTRVTSLDSTAANNVKNAATGSTLITSSGSSCVVDFGGNTSGYLNIVYIADYNVFGADLRSTINAAFRRGISISLSTTS